MKTRTKLSWILAAAVSATLAGSTMAQYRVGTDGRALDANNRIGSGGYNQGYQGVSPISNGNFLQNNLITGNITGGKEFRGSIPYTAPDAFRGNAAGSAMDAFVRSSSGAPYGGVPQNNAQTVQSFYGTSYAAPAPPNYVQQGIGAGAFVPAKTMSREASDLRLGQVMNAPTTTLPQPGQLMLPGPVDASTSNSTMITASPLYGVRQWNMGNLADQQFLNSNMSRGGLNAAGNRLDPVTLQKMRAEVLDPQNLDTQTGPIDQQNANSNPRATGAGTGTGTGRDAGSAIDRNLNGGPLSAIESPRNNSLSGASVLQSNQSQASGALGGDLSTGATVRHRLLTAPQQQSTQYAELQRRLQQIRSGETTASVSSGTPAEDFNQQMRDKKEAENKKEGQTAALPGGNSTLSPIQPQGARGAGAAGGMGAGGGLTVPNLPGPGAAAAGGNAPSTPEVTPRPSVVPVPTTPQAQKPAPVQIKSLAQGVSASGLASLLKDAETDMKAGKFNSALDKYDDAEQVAPNNPLILVGRANALLGQSYYSRAEQNLRRAFMQNQELLMGQYDLRSFLDPSRLDFIVKELKNLAEAEPKEPRHVFLLAYIAYNTGNEAMAASYLDLAEKRAGGNDPLYPLLRKYWSLPEQTSPPNK
jgi:hypothetical protein